MDGFRAGEQKGRKSSKRSRGGKGKAFRALIPGMPPTIQSVRKLRAKKRKGQQSDPLEVSILHPDFEADEKAQMAFDSAIFTKIPQITLVRHPYPSELNLRELYEKENGEGSAEGLLLMLNVVCPNANDPHMRAKDPVHIGDSHPLYEALSQGQCALVGHAEKETLFYGLMLQRLPIEVIADGFIASEDAA